MSVLSGAKQSFWEITISVRRSKRIAKIAAAHSFSGQSLMTGEALSLNSDMISLIAHGNSLFVENFPC
jgi:hypothetical protein